MIVDIDANREKPRDSGMVYSSFQTNIFKAIQNTEDHILVEAVAGSGKTTTILHALELIPAGKTAIFLAFNKSVADELAKKVPVFVEARTLHSLGMEILKKNFSYVKVNGRKTSNLLQYDILDTKTNNEYRDWYFQNYDDCKKLVSRMKSSMDANVSALNIEEWIDALDLDLPTDGWSMTVYQQLLEKSYEFTGEKGACVIDFDDMLCQPLLRNCSFPTYDYVLVDEAQDLNHVQRLFISRLLGNNSRLIAVGDTHQAIYGFRGASHNSMDLIRQHYNCRELPLSICYRCDTDIVELAQQYVPHIEARDNAGTGEVNSEDWGRHWDMYKNGDHILCRTNAPLVREAMRLSLRGNNVCILGNDIVPGIMKVAKEIDNDYGCISPPTINQYGQDNMWRIPENKVSKRQALQDKLEVLGYIVETRAMQSAEVKKVLDQIFFDKPPITSCITLSTIHKAKGLEADRVFIIRPDLIPWPYANTPEELQQEYNLLYVAITRAKHYLCFIQHND